ncbi:hypothetical protein BKA63DRAFT_231448 [Paraphoma chrysanthemicola]|nr:hypothetical protein BKA63DRAFT_231448 [Paraphoma chrysanthemicola]
MRAPYALRLARRFPHTCVQRSTHGHGAAFSSSFSLIRWQTTQSSPKSVFYRASGLERGTSREEVWNIIRRQLRNEDEEEVPDITVLPTCDSTTEDLSIAIVKYSQHQRPAFLADLDDNSSGQKVISTRDDDGGTRQIVFDRHFHGFTQLYPTADDTKVRADIIAITGMDGHAYGSWMSREGNNSAMWLRDFLARDLPDCRTMIYGYHSKLLDTNVNQLKEYGRSFFAELEKIRDTTELQRRPLIFICHSYGGVLLSHCLVRAYTLEDESRNSLYKSTYGMLFFGTPHRGSPKDDILKMVEQSYPNRIPALMQTTPESDGLMSQLQLFSSIVRDRQIGSFYETEPTPVPTQLEDGRWQRAGRPVLQVNEPSAILQFPGYRERKVPVNANHTNMVKFSSRVDPTYSTVLRMLREYVRDAEKVVASRYEPRIQSRAKRIIVPFNKTVKLHGRNDILARLGEKLETMTYHRRAALTGLGGIGKSAIAIKYARGLREKDPDTWILWVRSSTAARFSQSYREIADMLSIDGRDAPKVDVLRLVCDYLSEKHTGPWIMILDNADDQTLLSMEYARQEESTGQLRPLSFFLPQGSHGSILVTSRDKRVAEDLTGSVSSIVPVFALDEVDSIQLLRERSRDFSSPDEDVVELVKVLDNHALAIKLAAANILSRHTITHYLKKYRRALKNQQPEALVPQAVSMTWQLSFDTIRKHHPSSFTLLSLMSLLHFDDMPEFLFTDYMDRYGADYTLFDEDTEPLLRFSLIVPDGDNKFDMHRLVQHSTRSWLIANHEMHQRVREARTLIAEAFPDISAGHEDWKKCQALLPHAEATLSHDVGPENERQRLQRGKMLYNIAYFEYIKGDHAAALQHFVAAKQIQSEFLHESDKQLVQTRSMCYRLLSEMGQREEALHQMNSELRGLDQRSVYSLALLEEKARIMLDAGQWEQAEADARKALGRMMKQAGDGVSEVHKLDAKRTLARAINFQGEPEQAEPLLREVLKRREQLWSFEHMDTLKSTLDLAECLANQGRYKEAEALFEKADIGLRKFPGDDTARAEKLQNLREKARLLSEQHGLPALQRKLRRTYRLTKLRIFGSRRIPLLAGPPAGLVSSWWFYLIIALIASGSSMVTYNSKERITFQQLTDKLEQLRGHHKDTTKKMEANTQLDVQQDKEIQGLRNDIKQLWEEVDRIYLRLRHSGK